ncbi:MAG: hypothetical protein WCK05_08995 [Planctomycetota bacterium]
MFEPGDTLFFKGHLFVVLSNSDYDAGHIVLGMFTTWEAYKDPSCILHPGDHPFLDHDTCVDYQTAPLLSAKELDDQIRAGQMTRREKLSQSVLERVLSGAGKTQRIPNGCWIVLDNQDLV